MKDGFIRVAAATPDVKVADTRWNREQIEKIMKECSRRRRKTAGISRTFHNRLYLRRPVPSNVPD